MAFAKHLIFDLKLWDGRLFSCKKKLSVCLPHNFTLPVQERILRRHITQNKIIGLPCHKKFNISLFYHTCSYGKRLFHVDIKCIRHCSSKQCVDQVNVESYSSKDASETTEEKAIIPNRSEGNQPGTYSDGNAEELLKNSAAFEDDSPQAPGDIWSSSVYPANVDKTRDQARHSIRPDVDPRKTSVMLFPGQGAQFVGMGQNLLIFPNVKELYEVASEILGYDLLHLCINGPKSELNKTVNCQAAVLVTSLAAVERLRDEFPLAIQDCFAAAGFSVGEYTALVFAGALSFEDAVRLVKIRGEAMQAASELTPSGMMTVFCGPDSKLNFACHAAQEWCVQKGITDPVCSVANYLFPNCKVIAGNEEALKFIQLNAADFKIRRWKCLPVSGAFHTKLMKPAKEVLIKALNSVKFSSPLIPVYSNVDGKPYKNIYQITNKLVRQLCEPVKWEQTMHIIYECPSNRSFFPRTFECGPGYSLKSILKMVNSKAWISCSTVEV